MYSCNPIFIDIGSKTGYTNILEMAKRFGVGEKLLHPLEFDQSAGTLPDENNYYMADLANLSIGQGRYFLPQYCRAVSSVLLSPTAEQERRLTWLTASLTT